MRPVACPYESGVVAAAAVGSFDGDHQVMAHMDSCESCRDIAGIVAAFRANRDAAQQEVVVPASSQIWWRATIRARLEAAQTAARPITWLQGLLGACAAGLAVAVIVGAWPTIAAATAWLASWGAIPGPLAPEATTMVVSLASRIVAVTLALVVGAVLTPLLLYVVLSDD